MSCKSFTPTGKPARGPSCARKVQGHEHRIIAAARVVARLLAVDHVGRLVDLLLALDRDLGAVGPALLGAHVER